MATAELAVLLEEIRSDAVYDTMDITTTLRKCKVLAHEIDNAELERWSTWESLGYPTDQPVPLYRVWPMQLIGEFEGPFKRKKTAPIPQNFLPEYARTFREGYECRESASLIMDSLGKAEDSIVKIDTGELHLEVGKSLFRGYKCVSVRAEVNAGKLIEAVNAIRDNILNVTIKLLETQRETVQQEQLQQEQLQQEQQYQEQQYYQEPPRRSGEPWYDEPWQTNTAWQQEAPRRQHDQTPGLVVRRNILREQFEMEQAWAKVRPMGRA